MSQSLKTINDIQAALDHYNATYRREGLREWEWGQQLDLHLDERRDELTLCWKDSWPHGDRAGVYFVFAQDEHLLYVGKASMGSCMGARLSSWFQGSCDEICKIRGTWSDRPAHVRTLAVADEMRFEAAALEEFLINKLCPPDNCVGVKQIRYIEQASDKPEIIATQTILSSAAETDSN
ncbi:MAG: hypothetical protein ACO1TE_06785 [Prosthecobacter sp.]